jgi:mono/diheme cytochrome c family protein
MRNLSTVTILLAVLLVAAGCGQSKRLPLEPGGGEPDPTATFTRVQGEIFAVSCAFSGCHAGSAPASGLDLSPAAAWAAARQVSVEQPSLHRIEPSHPERSYMIMKVRGLAGISGSQMPLGGPYLSDAQLQLLTDWVRRGAPRD